MLEQNIGEAAGRGAAVDADHAVRVDGKYPQRLVQLETSAADKGQRVAADLDLRIRRDCRSGLVHTLTVDKYSNDGQNVQAITAATITSKAVVKAVNAATEAFNNLTGGASNG